MSDRPGGTARSQGRVGPVRHIKEGGLAGRRIAPTRAVRALLPPTGALRPRAGTHRGAAAEQSESAGLVRLAHEGENFPVCVDALRAHVDDVLQRRMRKHERRVVGNRRVAQQAQAPAAAIKSHGVNAGSLRVAAGRVRQHSLVVVAGHQERGGGPAQRARWTAAAVQLQRNVAARATERLAAIVAHRTCGGGSGLTVNLRTSSSPLPTWPSQKFSLTEISAC